MNSDIISLLSEGDKRTVNNVDNVVALVLEKPTLINQLLSCLDESDEVLAMHAADALQKLQEQKPELVVPQTTKLFQIFLKRDQKEIRWHMAQMLPKLPLSQEQLKQATAIWKHDFYDSKSSIVKTFSLQAIYDISLTHRKFLDDFETMLMHAIAKGTPAMKSRAVKLQAEYHRTYGPS